MKLEGTSEIDVSRTYSNPVGLFKQESSRSDDSLKETRKCEVKKPQHRIVELIRNDSLKSNSSSTDKVSVDFNTAIDKAGYGKFNYFLLLIAFPATCTSCFDTAAMAFVLPIAACELSLSTFQYGALNSVTYAGMICSAFLWGFLSDSFGRQKLMVAGYLLDAIMVIFSAFSQTFWWMAFFRFWSGFMICGPYSIFMAYLSEVFDSKHRDFAVMSSGLYYALGSILQPGIAMAIVPLKVSFWLPFGMELNSWRLFLLICSLPSLFSGVAAAFCVESPKFLLDQGRKDEALDVFKKIYTINTGLPPNTYPVKRLHRENHNGGDNIKNGSMGKMLKALIQHAFALFRPPHLKASLFTFSIQFLLISVLNVIRLWLPQMFSEMFAEGSENKKKYSTMCDILTAKNYNESIQTTTCIKEDVNSTAYLNMMIIYGICFFSNILANFAVRYVEKKKILIFSAAASAASILPIPLLSSSYVLPLASAYVSLLNVYFYVSLAVVVELFPTNLRATGVSLALMFGRIGLFFATLGLTQLLFIHCDLVFYFLGSIIIGLAIATNFIPKPLEAINEENPIKVDAKLNTA